MIKKNNIFIVNGPIGAGKSTFVKYLQNEVPGVFGYSYIKPVLHIVNKMGCTNPNTDEARILITNVESAWTKYNTMLIDNLLSQIKHNIKILSKANYHFISIKRPNTIMAFKYFFPDAKTILIERDGIIINADSADASIHSIKYDIVINNNGTLDDFHNTIDKFIGKNLNTIQRINKSVIKTTTNERKRRDEFGRFRRIGD